MSEFATATVHKSGNQLHVTHGDDKGLYVEFIMEPILQGHESDQAGHPVYKDIPHVSILFPGDNTKKVYRPVDMKGSDTKPSDPQRWPQQWAAFQQQAIQVQTGMPLTEWGPMTRSMALTLKGLGIHTVEQLAEMADHALSFMGAREMRDKAQIWLVESKKGVAAMALQQENEHLRSEIETLKRQFAELSASKRKPKEE
ncbi:bZIP transcription factor [Paludibacterium sp.]|uniref:bZIP transcription factor n=1 Tax=Paludibacterium sp. TaxID=1917523 RepID=UPI0025CE04E7|nr:bZIP transcription factor [Paludibacterium sp.]MBV8649687.1 hypothetical protein [Paludibacterium sp.]